MNKEQKAKSIDYLRTIFNSFKLLIILDIHKISAEEIRCLRKLLTINNICIKVFKNKLCKYAVKNTSLNVMSNKFAGQIALIWDKQNTPEAARILKTFQKDIISSKIKSGFHNGRIIDCNYIKYLSNIPNISTLRITIVKFLSQPSRHIMRNIQYPLQTIINMLNLKK